MVRIASRRGLLMVADRRAPPAAGIADRRGSTRGADAPLSSRAPGHGLRSPSPALPVHSLAGPEEHRRMPGRRDPENPDGHGIAAPGHDAHQSPRAPRP